MTIPEFEQKRNLPTEEFQKWFDDIASWRIDLCGQPMICMKLSKRKVGLRDGSIVEVADLAKITLPERRDEGDLKEMQRFYGIYKALEPLDRLAIYHLFDVFETKLQLQEDNMEKMQEIRENALCSFCGRSMEEVEKMIAGPNGMFICDECAKECMEALEEEE